MLLFEPPPSQGDLHFRVLGIPVRVHPFFWVGTVLLMIGGGKGTPPLDLLLWVVVVFASILVHELGHAFMQRHYGGSPWITLHAFGGLASCNDCDRGPLSQILISLAGPGAGFLVAAVTVAVMRLTGHAIGWTWGGEGTLDAAMEGAGLLSVHALGFLGGHLYWEPLNSDAMNTLLADVLQVNILWGVINLLPVYPLDGGRISRELCTLRQPQQGIITSLQISVAAAALMAVAGVLLMHSFFAALMFGYLAYGSYRMLEAYRSNAW